MSHYMSVPGGGQPLPVGAGVEGHQDRARREPRYTANVYAYIYIYSKRHIYIYIYTYMYTHTYVLYADVYMHIQYIYIYICIYTYISLSLSLSARVQRPPRDHEFIHPIATDSSQRISLHCRGGS